MLKQKKWGQFCFPQKNSNLTHFSRMLSLSFWSASDEILFPWFTWAKRTLEKWDCANTQRRKWLTWQHTQCQSSCVKQIFTLRGEGLSWTSPSMIRRTASSMSPLAIDRALRASERLHLGNISSRCCSWASHPDTGGWTYTHILVLIQNDVNLIKTGGKTMSKSESNSKSWEHESSVMSAEMITLAVAPSICGLRQCVSLLGGQSLGRVVHFIKTSSALAFGTMFSSSTEMEAKQWKSINCNRNAIWVDSFE